MLENEPVNESAMRVIECPFGHGLAHHISAVATGEVAAIRVSGIMDIENAGYVARQLQTLEEKNTYRNFSHMETIGLSYFEAINPEREEYYFSSANRVMEKLRSVFAPLPLPTDVIRTTLDESWPAGLMTLRHPSGKPMRPCLARTITHGSELAPHVDRCDWYSHATFKQPYAQMSGNIYLSTGDNGGELLVWNFQPDHPADPKVCECSVDDKVLGPPDLVLKPRPGEMILINSRFTHAVNKVVGLRSTLSFFLVLENQNGPLLMYH
jgi:hypothetical protein